MIESKPLVESSGNHTIILPSGFQAIHLPLIFMSISVTVLLCTTVWKISSTGLCQNAAVRWSWHKMYGGSDCGRHPNNWCSFQSRALQSAGHAVDVGLFACRASGLLERMTRQAVSLLSGTGDFPAHSLQAILAAYGRLRFHPGDAALASFTLGIARSLPRFQPGGWPLALGAGPHAADFCAYSCGLTWSHFTDTEFLQC